jgi:excisionase family DNA binding protein
MQEQKRFLTISEAAEFLHVSEVSLRRWTNSGKLRCFRVGGRDERLSRNCPLLTLKLQNSFYSSHNNR